MKPQRILWTVKPATRVKPSSKTYSRKKNQHDHNLDSDINIRSERDAQRRGR